MEAKQLQSKAGIHGEGLAYANRLHTALTTALGIELKRSPSETKARASDWRTL
jgi:hypothetical protein